MPDEQPVEGQDATASTGLFDSYLQAVPEDARETVASYLKDAEKNVNSRLEKAAELEKTWGPYQNVDALSQYPPEQLSELLAWHQQVTSSDEAFQQWLSQAAGEAGFTKAETEDLATAEETGELSQAKIEQLIQDRASQQLQPLEQKLSQWEEKQVLNETANEFSSEIARLEKEHGDFNEEVVKAIIDLGKDYEGEGSWVQAGYDRLEKISGDAQRAFVTAKSGQPAGALSAGGLEAFKATTSFKEAEEQLRERLRQTS